MLTLLCHVPAPRRASTTGITTFVCLQAEMPSPLTSANHPRVGASTQSVGVTARPYINDAQIIVDHGRGRFPQREPLSFIHLPIPSAFPNCLHAPSACHPPCPHCAPMHVPTCADDGAAVIDDAKLVPFVLDLISHLKAGEKLYIHCGDGNGRTGTVACALLGLLYNLSSSETLDLVQRFRNHRAGTQGHMPDSHEQKMQVHRLLADDRLRAAAAGVPPKKVRLCCMCGSRCYAMLAHQVLCMQLTRRLPLRCHNAELRPRQGSGSGRDCHHQQSAPGAGPPWHVVDDRAVSRVPHHGRQPQQQRVHVRVPEGHARLWCGPHEGGASPACAHPPLRPTR